MKTTKFANATIFTAMGYFAIFLVFSMVTGAPVEHTNIVRVVLIVSLGGLAIGLRLPPTRKANLAVSLVAVGFSFLGAELFLYFSTEGTNIGRFQEAAESQNVPWDTRTRFQVVEDLRNKGIDAHLALGPWLFDETGSSINGDELYAFGEISDTTIVLCNELGVWSIYQSDEFGFNNPRGIWGRDRIDSVSIGDSFIVGYCVSPEGTATALIRDVYKNSLNLGTTGTGPLMQLGVIKEYLGDLRPNVVFWFFYEGNDLPELLAEYKLNPLAKKYLGTDYRQNLLFRQEEIDRAKKNVSDELLSQKLKGNATTDILLGRLTLRSLRNEVFSEVRARINNRQGEKCPTENMMPLLAEVLGDAVNFVDSWEGELYLVYLPSWTRYADPNEACVGDRGDKYQHDRVLSIAARAGVSVIDITQSFGAHPDALSLFPFRQSGHYNEAGYKLIADTILQATEFEVLP